MAYNATNPNGQATSANSAPVVIASDNVVDVASNQVMGSGSITAADAASTTASGQANQVLISGTPTANSVYSLAIPNVNGTPESFSSVVIGISGTFVGTYTFERSPDSGATWTPFSPFVAGQGQTTASGTLPGMFHGNISGVTNVRVRCTAFTSGTIAVKFSYGIGTGTVTVGNPLRLYDITNNTQATIKPASTAPAATDTAIVTVESPNSPLINNTGNIPAKGQTTMANSMPVAIASDQSTVKVKLANDIASVTGTITTASSTVTTTTLVGVGSLMVSTYGTHSGVTITFEISDGTNWYVYPVQSIGSVTPSMITTGALTSNQTNFFSVSPLLGVQAFRVRATAYTSGTVNVILAPSAQFTQSTVNVATMPTTTVTGSVGLSAGSNIVGFVYLNPSSTGAGLTTYSNQALSNTVTSVKSTGGRIFEYDLYNPNTSGVWVQFFDLATTSVTLGTTGPKRTLYIPASSGRDSTSPYSIQWNTAISIACTTTNTGSTAPATPIQIYVGYI